MRRGTPEFVGSRLTEARGARGLSGTALAIAVGVSRQAISQYEKRNHSPSPEVLGRLCSVLDVPPSYFVTQTSESVGPLFFRSFASATRTERQKQVHQQKWRHRLVRFLNEYFDFPSACIPQLYKGDPEYLSDREIEKYASEIRSIFGIGNGPISSVVRLLENHGAIIVRTAFDAESLDAFSEWESQREVAYFILNADKESAVRSRFDLCHELGHMALHRHLSSASHANRFRLLERQAHRFAGAFLAPSESFAKSCVWASLEDLIEVKRVWGMSISAMLARSRDLGLISESIYRRKMTQLGRRRWRKREPLDGTTLPEQPMLLRRGIDTLLETRIVGRRDLEELGAGSLRDIERCVGLPHGYLDEPIRTKQAMHIFRFRAQES
jgi:Zn-dependent peptidase ImmA (M78 family)/DNA-binding XRE family transcriptional regulator